MGTGMSVASSLPPTAAGLTAAAILCPPAGLAAGAIFGVGVAVGAASAWGGGANKATHALFDALDAVDRAAETVMSYLRAAKDAVYSAAAWAWDKLKQAAEKLKEAAASLVDRVVKLLRHLRGRKEAAAAKREMDRAAARAQQQTCPDVFAEAAARVARSRRCIVDAAAAASSSAVVPCYAAAPTGGASSDDAARRAARSAAEMMAFVAEVDLGDGIPPAARSFITVIAAAAAVCLDIVVSPTATA